MFPLKASRVQRHRSAVVENERAVLREVLGAIALVGKPTDEEDRKQEQPRFERTMVVHLDIHGSATFDASVKHGEDTITVREDVAEACAAERSPVPRGETEAELTAAPAQRSPATAGATLVKVADHTSSRIGGGDTPPNP